MCHRKMKQFALGTCLCLTMIGCTAVFTPSALAYREPVFTTNLGGTPISCSIYSEQAALHGVYTGDSSGQVIEKLKMPNSTYKRAQGCIVYYYKGLKINMVNFSGKLYTVTDIEASQAGYYTPDGVGVGMSEQVLSDVYGTADSVWTKTYVSPKLSDEVNKKNQARFNEIVYTYNANQCLSMSFIVKQGCIVKINIHRSE